MLAQIKATKLGAGGLAWVLSFILADVTTGQAVIAAFFACVSAILAAWLATRPALTRERNQKELTEEDRQVRWLQGRIQYHSQVVVLVRISKHNALGYIDSCHKWIWDEMARARAEGRQVPSFEFKYHDDLCGEEDRGMAQLALSPDIHTTGTQTGETPKFGG
ncbi:MAG TPA: hypothetical protein VF297_05160 [Pyrinomonadaceae bacterium]